MKAYKGFNKNMKCRDFQYNEGKTYTTDRAKVCDCGFHACEYPLGCLSYYAPGKEAVYHEVELSGHIDKQSDDDTKVAAEKIKIGERMSIAGLVKATVDFIMSRVKSTAKKGDDRSAASATGYCSIATNRGFQSAASAMGVRSAATNTGDCSAALATGNCSAAEVSKKPSVAIVTGLRGKARGAIGSWIVLTERDDNCDIIGMKAFCIDGEKYKANTWYTLSKGKVVKVE